MRRLSRTTRIQLAFEQPMAKKRPKCPSCNSKNVVPIVFGYPDPETMEARERGDVALGGCCVTEDDPDWHCKDCEHEW